MALLKMAAMLFSLKTGALLLILWLNSRIKTSQFAKSPYAMVQRFYFLSCTLKLFLHIKSVKLLLTFSVLKLGLT